MTRFKQKELSFGFVILAPEHNIGRIRGTFRSIKNHYRADIPVICIVGDDTTTPELKEIKEICPVYKGKGTITSLLNAGLSKGHKEWNIFLMEGVTVQQKLDHKLGYWVEDEKDILFPIAVDYNREGIPIKIYNQFYESTLNGLCINQKMFKLVGEFTENPLEISRKFWAFGAAEQGARFKAILGIKLV